MPRTEHHARPALVPVTDNTKRRFWVRREFRQQSRRPWGANGFAFVPQSVPCPHTASAGIEPGSEAASSPSHPACSVRHAGRSVSDQRRYRRRGRAQDTCESLWKFLEFFGDAAGSHGHRGNSAYSRRLSKAFTFDGWFSVRIASVRHFSASVS